MAALRPHATPTPAPTPTVPDDRAAETAPASDETALSLSPGGTPERRDPAEPPVDSLALARAADGRSFDRLLARLIVEKGLATQEEVDACLPSVIGSWLSRRKTFADRLLERQALTPNQLERLRQSVESQKAARSIPGFKMIARIGKGTTAVVFKARQLNLDRIVAIKVLGAEALRSPKSIEHFLAEGRATAQLNHANIVQAFDVGQAGNYHYLVMEYVEGKTVYEVLDQQGPYEPGAALDLIIAMGEALEHAHDRGLVHRDVKPKNIIISGRGIPKLADLGLARAIDDRKLAMAERGKTLGTPYYISPEQVRGDVEIGPASDIYSLGATFFHMVTGRPPFCGRDVHDVMDQHLKAPVPSAMQFCHALNPGVSEVIDKMLAKDALERYTDCANLLTDLRAWRAVLLLQRGEAPRRA